MKWNYICPLCKEWRKIDWSEIDNSHICHITKQNYYPPRPKNQYDAFVDTHNWPQEMETVVIDIKGKNCTVPGCQKKYETLDHRMPYSKGGPTSVNNLFPMCTFHNQSKGDTEYYAWLRSIGK